LVGDKVQAGEVPLREVIKEPNSVPDIKRKSDLKEVRCLFRDAFPNTASKISTAKNTKA
jgi:hypothetical protein